jgi:hypothetical protein
MAALDGMLTSVIANATQFAVPLNKFNVKDGEPRSEILPIIFMDKSNFFLCSHF